MGSCFIQWKDPRTIPQEQIRVLLTVQCPWDANRHIIEAYNKWDPLKKKYSLATSANTQFGVPYVLPDYVRVLAWDYHPLQGVDFVLNAYKGGSFSNGRRPDA